MNEDTPPTNEATRLLSRLDAMRLTTVLGMLGCILISFRMWSLRTFPPNAPVWEGFAIHSQTVSILLQTALLLSLGALLWPKWTRNVRWGWIGMAVSSILWLTFADVMRWQPWVFHFSALLLLFAFAKEPDETASSIDFHHARKWAGWLHAAIYLWAGWHKINPMFAKTSINFVLNPLPPSLQQSVLSIKVGETSLVAIVLPLLEMSIGLLLLNSKSRKIGVLFATMMHGLIIFLLLHINYDKNVIPWNLCMLALNWLLFWPPVPNTTSPSRHRFFSLGLIGLLALPGLHTFGKLDANLAFSLYSGNYNRFDIFVPVVHQQVIPNTHRQFLVPAMPLDAHGQALGLGKLPKKMVHPFDINRWATSTFDTTLPPTRLAGKSYFRALCNSTSQKKAYLLLIMPKSHGPFGFPTRKATLYTCADVPKE
jgi:hypothetical protein